MAGLTQDELKLLDKYNKEKEAHKKRQQEYSQRKKEQNPQEYKETLNKYMKDYNAKKRDEINKFKNKIDEEPLKEFIKPLEIIEKDVKPLEPIKTIKNNDDDINKSLKKSTIEQYLKKASIIHRLFKNKDLTTDIKEELKKLFNKEDNINEDLIISQMDYLKNEDEILTTLKNRYKSLHSLKGYLNIIVVITRQIKPLFNIYSVLTKINTDNNNKIQNERDDNKLNEDEKDKIISLDKNKILNDIKKLKDPLDILIFALYTLQPCRRLEYKNMKIIKEPEKYKLDDLETNYLILSSPERFIFNDYKTNKTYGQQTINILDPLLINIIKQYISINNIQDGEYLIHQKENKNKHIKDANFSRKISKVFYKVLNINTSLDFIRKSHIIHFIDGGKRSNNEKEIFASYCGHSVEEQSKYYKIV